MRPVSSFPGRWSGHDIGLGAPLRGAPVVDDPDRTLDLPAAMQAIAPTTVDMFPAAGPDDGQSDPNPGGNTALVAALAIPQAESPAPPEVDPEPSPAVAKAPQPALSVSQPKVVEVGTVLGNRYRLTEQIGVGGSSLIFGATDLYRHHDQATSAQVAVKVLKPEFRTSGDAVGRLQREFNRLQILSHPAISRAHDLDHDGEVWFLVLDRLEGDPLSTVLARNLRRPMVREQALKIIRDSGEALDFAHQHRILHCDFKPGNVLVGDEDDIRIIDFGSGFDQSSAAGPDEKACIDSRQATPAYASPERLSGAPPDIRDDVFSFAAVVYELLSGKRLQGNEPVSADRGVSAMPPRPEGLTDLQWERLTGALSPLRDERLASLRPLLDAFAPRASSRGGKGTHRALAALLAVVLILAGISVYRAFSTPAEAPARVSTDASIASQSATPPTPVEAVSPAPPAIVAAPALLPPPVDTSATRPAIRPRALEPQVSSVTLDQADLRVTRPTSMAAMILQRTAGPERRVRLRWRTVPGTALPGIDYSPVEAGVVQLADNQDRSSLYVPLLRRDNVGIDRTFYIEISSDDPAVNVGPVSRVTVTITGRTDPVGSRTEDSAE